MAQLKAQANTYSTDITLSTGGLGLAFGFDASLVRIANDSGVPIRFTLGSTGAASTADPELKAGESFGPIGVPPIAGLGLWTTSTSAPAVRVQAWGG